MPEEFRIVCTDRGEHGSLDLGGLRIGAHGVEEVRLRQSVAPWGKGAVAFEPGEEVRHPLDVRVPIVAGSVRVDYDGRRRFQFRCKVCYPRYDVKWTEATAVRVLNGYEAAGRRVIDISRLAGVS